MIKKMVVQGVFAAALIAGAAAAYAAAVTPGGFLVAGLVAGEDGHEEHDDD